MRWMALLLLLGYTIAPAQTFYKCKGEHGETVVSSTPCGKDAEAIHIQQKYDPPGKKYDFPQLPEPLIGLDTNAARMGLEEWCGPTPKINRSVRLGHVSEQWVCLWDRYIYFRDGVLTSFQD